MARKNKEQNDTVQPMYPANVEEIKANMAKLQAQLAAIPTTPQMPPSGAPWGYQAYAQPQAPQQPIQPQTQPTEQPPQPQGNEPVITVKLAAREVYRWLKVSKSQFTIAIAAPWIVALCAMFNPIVGAVAAAAGSGVMIFALFKYQSEMKRLEQKYHIDPKTGQ